MKKIIRYYDMAVARLCGYGSDKYLHLVAGVLIAYIVAEMTGYALVGMIAAALAGVGKETLDYIRHKPFEMADILFTCVGGAIGCMLNVI